MQAEKMEAQSAQEARLEFERLKNFKKEAYNRYLKDQSVQMAEVDMEIKQKKLRQGSREGSTERNQMGSRVKPASSNLPKRPKLKALPGRTGQQGSMPAFKAQGKNTWMEKLTEDFGAEFSSNLMAEFEPNENEDSFIRLEKRMSQNESGTNEKGAQKEGNGGKREQSGFRVRNNIEGAQKAGNYDKQLNYEKVMNIEKYAGNFDEELRALIDEDDNETSKEMPQYAQRSKGNKGKKEENSEKNEPCGHHEEENDQKNRIRRDIKKARKLFEEDLKINEEIEGGDEHEQMIEDEIESLTQSNFFQPMPRSKEETKSSLNQKEEKQGRAISPKKRMDGNPLWNKEKERSEEIKGAKQEEEERKRVIDQKEEENMRKGANQKEETKRFGRLPSPKLNPSGSDPNGKETKQTSIGNTGPPQWVQNDSKPTRNDEQKPRMPSMVSNQSIRSNSSARKPPLPVLRNNSSHSQKRNNSASHEPFDAAFKVKRDCFLDFDGSFQVPKKVG